MSGDKTNILVAYPYMSDPTIKELAKNSHRIRFVLDSGAFTAWKAGKPIELDDYCRFIESLPFEPWRYFTLDVIGDPDGSMRNYETMLARGFNPVPIFTRGECPSVLDDLYKTSDVVGIGGLVGTPGNRGFINGIMKHIGDRKVHWLGFARTEFVKHYKPYMCDSSSWAAILIFANMSLYDRDGVFVNAKKTDFIKRPSDDIIRLLLEYGINPRDLAKRSSWKNTGRGDNPVEKIGPRSYVKYQIETRKKDGTEFFLAVASDWQIRFVLEAADYWARVGYEG